MRRWCPLSSRVCWSGCCSRWSLAGTLCWSRGCPAGGRGPELWPAPHGSPCPPVRHTHMGICGLLGFVCPIRMFPVSHVTFYSRPCLAFCWSLCPTLGDDEVLFPLPLFGSSPGVVTSAPWWLLGSVVSLLSLLLFRVLTMGWSYGPGLAQSYTGRYHQ